MNTVRNGMELVIGRLETNELYKALIDVKKTIRDCGPDDMNSLLNKVLLREIDRRSLYDHLTIDDLMERIHDSETRIEECQSAINQGAYGLSDEVYEEEIRKEDLEKELERRNMELGVYPFDRY